MTNLGDTLDNIKEARIKLEGVGLVKTYVKEGSVNSYVYELFSPLSVSEFLIIQYLIWFYIIMLEKKNI